MSDGPSNDEGLVNDPELGWALPADQTLHWRGMPAQIFSGVAWS